MALRLEYLGPLLDWPNWHVPETRGKRLLPALRRLGVIELVAGRSVHESHRDVLAREAGPIDELLIAFLPRVRFYSFTGDVAFRPDTPVNRRIVELQNRAAVSAAGSDSPPVSATITTGDGIAVAALSPVVPPWTDALLASNGHGPAIVGLPHGMEPSELLATVLLGAAFHSGQEAPGDAAWPDLLAWCSLLDLTVVRVTGWFDDPEMALEIFHDAAELDTIAPQINPSYTGA